MNWKKRKRQRLLVANANRNDALARQAVLGEAIVYEELVGRGLALRTNGNHWMVLDGEKHIVHYWPSNQSWWSPLTKEKGKIGIEELAELSSKLACKGEK